MKKVGFLQESEGVNSITRLIFFVGSLWNMAINTVLVLRGVDPSMILALFTGVEGMLAGMKLWQKHVENA